MLQVTVSALVLDYGGGGVSIHCEVVVCAASALPLTFEAEVSILYQHLARLTIQPNIRHFRHQPLLSHLNYLLLCALYPL